VTHAFPFGRSVVVFREVRNAVGDVDQVDRFDLDAVSISPRVSNEFGTDSRNAVVTTGLTMLVADPSDAERITPQHRVEIDGIVYRVQGSPARWASPLTGWAPGTQVELDRVTG
jgi:hypothetical protein